MLDMLPEWLQIFVQSMIPWWEGRYAIIFAILHFNWQWWQAFPIAVAGNMLPVPFILLFFHAVEKFLRRFRSWSRLMDWLFAKTRKRADKKIRQYKYLGLLLFVAIPLPFTGAWTGSLIAYLFDLKFSRSLLTIFIGVLIAIASIIYIMLKFMALRFGKRGGKSDDK